jgi:hypothetical protein
MESIRMDVQSSTATKTVRIGGADYLVSGSESDSYWTNLQAFIDGHPQLALYTEHHLAQDSVCLDVGANIGATALLLARRCERLFAIEASPINAEFLRQNISNNGIENCTTIEAAVGAEAGTLTLHTSGAGSHVMTETHLYRDSWPSVKVPECGLVLAPGKRLLACI